MSERAWGWRLGHAWGLSCNLHVTLRGPPHTAPCEHSIALTRKQVGRRGFLGRQGVSDAIRCERFGWIDMRAHLAIVCEARFRAPQGRRVRVIRRGCCAIRTGQVDGNASGSEADRSYLALAPGPYFCFRGPYFRLIPSPNAGIFEVWLRL